MDKKNNNLKDSLVPKLPYFIFVLVIVIIFAGAYIHNKIAVQRNLDEHFGDVQLSDEEIESLAKSIVNPSSNSMDGYSFEIPYKNGFIDWNTIESNFSVLSAEDIINQNAPSNQYVLVNGFIYNISDSTFNLSIPRDESFYKVIGWHYDPNLKDVVCELNNFSDGDFVEICCITGAHGQISYTDGVLAIRKVHSEPSHDNGDSISDESSINNEITSSDKSTIGRTDDSGEDAYEPLDENAIELASYGLIFKGDVNNDLTGNWRYASYDSDISQETIAIDYCNTYFNSAKEIHALINKYNNTVACIQYITFDLLDVTIHEYTKGEEHNAKELFCGDIIAEYYITISTGEIENALEE